MKTNMGTIDRITRLVIFAAITALYFGGVLTGTLGIVLLVLGVVFFLTSFVGFCPLYAPFKLNTCEKS
jgi:hypothetical protein